MIKNNYKALYDGTERSRWKGKITQEEVEETQQRINSMVQNFSDVMNHIPTKYLGKETYLGSLVGVNCGSVIR